MYYVLRNEHANSNLGMSFWSFPSLGQMRDIALIGQTNGGSFFTFFLTFGA